ncbi:MAG: glycosyltransferase family 39 protein [Pyrinomonadaceae bacterium]
MYTDRRMNLKNEATATELPSSPTSGFFSRRSHLVLLALIVALFLAARLWGLTSSCLWFDEVFSVHAARHDWTQLVSFVAADIIHPPLFYVLLKTWTGIGGESLLWLRLFPALTSIAAIVPFILLCRELKLGTAATNLALLLMAVNGFLIKYAQELRMYSLLLFFALCSLWLFVRVLKASASAKREMIALGSVNLLLVYTHYSGWVLVALQAVALLVWKRGRLPLFLAAGVVLLLAYIPWIYAVSKAAEPGKGLAQNIGWVSRPDPKELVQSFTILNKPFLFGQSTAQSSDDSLGAILTLLLFIFPLLSLLWHGSPVKDKQRSEVLQGLVLFAFAPMLLFFVMSWLLPYSIWGTRHLIIAAGPYSILVAIALTRLRPYWARVAVLLLLGCWVFFAGTLLVLKRPPFFIWCAWEQLAVEMVQAEQGSNGTVRIYAFEDLVAYHLWFGLSNGPSSRFNVAVIKDVPGLPEDPAYFLPRKFDDIGVEHLPEFQGDQVWIAFRAAKWNETGPPLNLLTPQGYHTGKILSIKAQGHEAFLVQLYRPTK